MDLLGLDWLRTWICWGWTDWGHGFVGAGLRTWICWGWTDWEHGFVGAGLTENMDLLRLDWELCLWGLNSLWGLNCSLCPLQDIRVDGHPSPGQRPDCAGQGLRPCHIGWSDWRDRHRPGEPLPDKDESDLRHSADLLHVSVSLGAGCIAQLVKHWAKELGAILTQGVDCLMQQRFFSPRVDFQCMTQVSCSGIQPLRAVTCIIVCWKSQTLLDIPLIGHTEILHTLVGMGNAALAAAVALSG